MSHADLVQLAARWLRGTRKCIIVATERQDWRSGESPDAIGWRRDGLSILVEAKTNRADFLADRRKPHRIAGGMGRERWYLAPEGVVRPEELTDGWGLLVLRSGRVFRVVEAQQRTPEVHAPEMPLLVAITRRALAGSGKGCTVVTNDSDVEAA